MKSYEINQNQRRAPYIILLCIALYVTTQYFSYTAGRSTLLTVLEFVVFGFTVYALFYMWLKPNTAGIPAVGLRELLLVLVAATSAGAGAYLFAISNKEFGFLFVAQIFAFLSLAHIAVALVYLAVIGAREKWWFDDRWYMRFVVPLFAFILWITVVAGASLSESPVWLFHDVGVLFSKSRFVAFLVIPLTFIIMWINNRIVWNRYKGVK